MAGLDAQWSSANDRSGHREGNPVAQVDGVEVGEARRVWRWVVQRRNLAGDELNRGGELLRDDGTIGARGAKTCCTNE
jgi:hypothetical protein